MSNKLIYDIGMNNGDDSAYYLSQGYNVLAVDASPKLVDIAKRRFSQQLTANRIEIINVGIAGGEGKLDFYVNKQDSAWSSFDKTLGQRGNAGYEIINVPTTSLDRLISEKGLPHYLKVDIEGYDKYCLEALFKCEIKPLYLSIEVYEIEQIEKIAELGYSKFKIIDQLSFLPLEIPAVKEYLAFRKHYYFQHSMNPFVRICRKLFGKNLNKWMRERYKKIFNYNHPFGSSGPFGEMLPGKWMTLEQINKVFIHYQNDFAKSTGSKAFGLWIDLHATR